MKKYMTSDREEKKAFKCALCKKSDESYMESKLLFSKIIS